MKIRLKRDSVYSSNTFITCSLLVIVAVGFAASNGITAPPNYCHDEEYFLCANFFNPTCADPDLGDLMMSRSECEYACACKKKLVRPVTGSRQCIPIKDCAKKKNSRPIAKIRSTTRLSTRRNIKRQIRY